MLMEGSNLQKQNIHKVVLVKGERFLFCINKEKCQVEKVL